MYVCISQINCHGFRENYFSSDLGRDKFIYNPTHRSGDCLDSNLTNNPGVIANIVSEPTGNFCHSYASAIFKTEHSVPNIYLK